MLVAPLVSYSQTVKYVSDVDQALMIKTVLVAPLPDNVGGIYATPLNETLKKAIESFHQWNIKIMEPSPSSTEDYEVLPDLVKQETKSFDTDALLTGRISQGPKGITIKLALYSGADGLPIGFQTLTDYPGFDINDLNLQLENLLKLLKTKLPYHGLILSRKGQLVTLNMGSNLGLRPGLEVIAIQVVKVNRHPRFGFIVSHDNLALGKISINKVDDFLSFGTITSEREAGVIGPDSKINFGNTIQYPNSGTLSDGSLVARTNERLDSSVSFGTQSKEWLPALTPSFGRLSLMFGLGSYNVTNSLSSGTINGRDILGSSLHFNGELWLRTELTLGFFLRNYINSINNDLSGSSPSTLNASTTHLGTYLAYNFLLTENYFGPRLALGMGYSSFSTHIDDSTYTTFTSTIYRGLFLNIGGFVPLDRMSEELMPNYTLGARLHYFIYPSLSELPTSSGTPNNAQISSFSLSLDKKWREYLTLHGEVLFNTTNAHFTGPGSRPISSSSSSESFFNLIAGVDFLF